MQELVLASSSRRRKDILEFLGVPFTVVSSNFPEENVKWVDFDDPADYVLTIAMGKVLTVADNYPEALILGADTSVFLDSQTFGKPKDLDDARRILKTLRGRTHTVVTGFTLLNSLTSEQYSEAVHSQVTFFSFSDEELERYLATSESLGKAGAYAIQFGAKSFAKEVKGSLSNVVGLPMEEVAMALENFGIPIEVNVRNIVERCFTH